jgi:hypothetical protein
MDAILTLAMIAVKEILRQQEILRQRIENEATLHAFGIERLARCWG